MARNLIGHRDFMLRRRKFTTVLTLTIASMSLCAVGCDNSDPAPSIPPPATGEGMSTRWIPNPAVDLMSPEGTFIRAFVESREAALTSFDRTGLEAIESDGYPGFARAFNRLEPPEQIGGLYPDLGRWGAGTWYYEVVEMLPQGNGFAAVVCAFNSLVAERPNGGDVYRSGGGDDLGQASRLTFAPDPQLPPEEQKSPAAHQQGPARRPVENVFGTWVATDYDYLGAEPAECNRLAPGTPSDWPSPYYRKDPPPTLSPEPGWPTGSPA